MVEPVMEQELNKKLLYGWWVLWVLSKVISRRFAKRYDRGCRDRDHDHRSESYIRPCKAYICPFTEVRLIGYNRWVKFQIR
jgi:hypothetical protein